MSKLDLRTALQIKNSTTAFSKLKGQGFSWSRETANWTPHTLFADNQRGFWANGFKPAENKMFQSSAGPEVTEINESIAFCTNAAYDGPRNLSNIIYGSGWTAMGDGVYQKEAVGTANIYQSDLVAPPLGSFIKITVDILSQTEGAIQILRRNNTNTGNETMTGYSSLGQHVTIAKVLSNFAAGITNSGLWIDATAFVGSITVKFELFPLYSAMYDIPGNKVFSATAPKTGIRNLISASEDFSTFYWRKSLPIEETEIIPNIQGIELPSTSWQNFTIYDVTNDNDIDIDGMTGPFSEIPWPDGDDENEPYRRKVTFTVPQGCEDIEICVAKLDEFNTIVHPLQVQEGEQYVLSWYSSGTNIGGVQIEKNPYYYTKYQKVIHPYNVTEANVSTIWYGMNENWMANLNIVLPAGNYRVAFRSLTSSYLDMMTSDGVTPINVVPIPDVVDFVIREGEFTEDEIASILLYWTRLYVAP